ncbi:MAG: JAB domain-containing protein [Bacteroidetes bacterium]|nr:JAB domain-containing protein [Bacteroidota bacterium]
MEISEIEINYKPLKKTSDLTKVTTSRDASDFFRQIWSERMQYVEEFYVLLLNRSNLIIGYLKLSEGGTNGTVVDAKIVFQASLKANAQAIILCHNHPSGNLKPSEADIGLTKKIKQAGITMDIPVLDHVILTYEGYFSFADEGLM